MSWQELTEGQDELVRVNVELEVEGKVRQPSSCRGLVIGVVIQRTKETCMIHTMTASSPSHTGKHYTVRQQPGDYSS